MLWSLIGRNDFRASVRDSLKLELESLNPAKLVLELPFSVLRKKQRKLGPKKLATELTDMLNGSVAKISLKKLKLLARRSPAIVRASKPDSYRLIVLGKLDKKVEESFSKLSRTRDLPVKLINHFNHLAN